MKRTSRTKRLGTFSGFFLIFWLVCGLSTPSGSTQQNVDPPCPAVELLCPAYLVSGVDPITLRADVVGGKESLGNGGLNQLGYDWQISGSGTITGQGTSQVVISATKGGKAEECITVNLQIKGMPPTCASTKTCKLRVSQNCAQPLPNDEYRGVALNDEKVHLDKVAQIFDQGGPNSVLYLVAYAGRSACVSEAQWRATKAKEYLTATHHIQENRIITVNGGFRESFAMEFFVLPADACGPLPTPTLRASEVEISGLCVTKYID